MNRIIENEISLNEVDVQKLDMKTGQILVVTVRHDDVAYEHLTELQKQFAKLLPDNKVLVFNVGSEGDVRLAVIDQPEKPVAKTSSICDNCNCGKKENQEDKQ